LRSAWPDFQKFIIWERLGRIFILILAFPGKTCSIITLEAVHEAVLASLRVRCIANKVFLTITTVLHHLQLAVLNFLAASEMSSQAPTPAGSFFPSSNVIITGGAFIQNNNGTKSRRFRSDMA